MRTLVLVVVVLGAREAAVWCGVWIARGKGGEKNGRLVDVCTLGTDLLLLTVAVAVAVAVAADVLIDFIAVLSFGVRGIGSWDDENFDGDDVGDEADTEAVATFDDEKLRLSDKA